MARDSVPQVGRYRLTAVQDVPDARDWVYRPALIELSATRARPRSLHIRDQGAEGACTGFGLAAVIDLLNARRRRRLRVSARMLYEMARKFDEWPGEAYAGSSCRGAIRGWVSMGVCRETLWPYKADRPGELTVAAAKDARANTIGAYYRLQHRVADFHAALNEAGVIYCSAQVHAGWERRALRNGVIRQRAGREGGHAFAIVGYDKRGFWVQNSWGRDWGDGGTALWSYEDWFENLNDAWVLSLALPTPQIEVQALDAQARKNARPAGRLLGPTRGEIAGHFVHLDDGRLHDRGRYWSNLADVRQTAALLAASEKYDHLLIYAHGGLNSPTESATRIRAMKEVFKANRVYPYHVMYDTGLLEELKDVILRRRGELEARAGGLGDWWDRMLEALCRTPGRALWREMKRGARLGFAIGADGSAVLRSFVDALRTEQGARLKIHLVGHSTGAILLAYLLEALEDAAPGLRLASLNLMAPAATVDLFRERYLPLLHAPDGAFGIDRLRLFNLSDRLERDDSVGPYRKSLLYFVSRAFEEQTPAALLGMQRHVAPLEEERIPRFEVIYSGGADGAEPRSRAESHGGFDNDPATLNAILADVLGQPPRRPFRDRDLDY